MYADMDAEATRHRIEALKAEHRDLDQMITRLAEATICDELQLKRLKKRKLQIKDQLVFLQIQLEPDIPA